MTTTWVLPDVVSDISYTCDPVTYYTPVVHSTYYIKIVTVSAVSIQEIFILYCFILKGNDVPSGNL